MCKFLRELYCAEGKPKGFNFADHQVEYLISKFSGFYDCRFKFGNGT